MSEETCSITRRFQFCAGHRVYQHESKCNNPHGHNYVLLVTVTGPRLDSLGRVIDFSVIKERVGSWIDLNWDHGFIYYGGDPLLCELYSNQLITFKSYRLGYNPTAENMALHLMQDILPRLFKGTEIIPTKVLLYETENCSAEVTNA